MIKSINTNSKSVFRLLDWSKVSEFNRLFELSVENNPNRTRYTWYFLPRVEMEDYSVMIDGRNFSDQPFKVT